MSGIIGKGGLVTPSGEAGSKGLDGWVFSGEGTIPATNTEYMLISGNEANPNGENRNQTPMPKAGKVTGFRVESIRNTISGNPSVTVTIRKNGIDTALTLQFSSLQTAIKEIFSDVTFVKDDLIGIEIIGGAGGTSAILVCETQLVFDP